MTTIATIAIRKDTLVETAICLIVEDAQTPHADSNPSNKHTTDLGHGTGHKQTMQLNNILMTKTTQSHFNQDIPQLLFKPLFLKKPQKKRHSI